VCGLGMERRVVPPVSFKANPIVHLWIKHRLADRMPVLWGPVKLSSIDALCEWGPARSGRWGEWRKGVDPGLQTRGGPCPLPAGQSIPTGGRHENGWYMCESVPAHG